MGVSKGEALLGGAEETLTFDLMALSRAVGILLDFWGVCLG